MHPQTEDRFTVALRHHTAEVEAAIREGNTARALTHALSLEAMVRRRDEEEKQQRAKQIAAQQAAAVKEAVVLDAVNRWLREKEGLCAAMLAANPGLSPEDITLCHDSTSGTTRVWAEIKKRR